MNIYITIDNKGFMNQISAISWNDAENKIKDNPNIKVHGKLIETIDKFTGEVVNYDKISQN
jgi:hypothetical protein